MKDSAINPADPKRSIISWSGGKDSCFALMKAMQQGYTPVALLNVMNESGKRSRSHGLSHSILQQQANALNVPLHTIESSWEDYESNFVQGISELKKQYNASDIIFGDIDLQQHRDWEEKVAAAAGLRAVLPLWLANRKSLVLEMISQGMEAMIISCNNVMGQAFLGRIITVELVNTLENMGIDPCGENGEYHTVVLNCPLYSTPLSVIPTQKEQHNNYWFLGLE